MCKCVIESTNMVNTEAFKEIALSFSATEQKPHFERLAFKVIKQKIFATLDEKLNMANLLLSPEDQSVFCLIDKNAIYAVRNKFGLQGWTTFELTKVSSEIMSDALSQAYRNIVESKKKHKKQ